MLWIHIGNDGVLDCKVNVGNKIRQGDGFDVFLSTENNGIATYEVEGLGYVKPGSDEVSNLNVTVEKSSQTFYLGSPSQANAFFRNGVEYDGYLGSIPSDATTFYANGGHIQLLIYISKDGGVTQHAENATIFVEPTYGKHYMGISCNDYEYLMEILGKHESDISNKLDKITLFNQSVASFVNFTHQNGIVVEKINNGYPIVTVGDSKKIAMRASTSADSKVASGTISINTLNVNDTSFAKFRWSLNRAKGSGEKSLEAWFSANGSSKKFYLAQRGEVEAEAEARAEADSSLQGQIDAINQSQNFVATVATHADLLTYDTTKLQDGDCILVLRDETHSNSPYVYKWVVRKGFDPVGEVGDSYTKAQSDAKFLAKVTAEGDNRVYAVRSNGEQFMEAYSNIATPDYLVKRTSDGNIRLPSQTPDTFNDQDAAVSLQYFNLVAVRKGFVNSLSASTQIRFARPTGGLSLNLDQQGVSFLDGQKKVYGIGSKGFSVASDSGTEEASWEDVIGSVSKAKLISNYATTETDAVTTHNVSLAKEDGKRNFYKFTVGAASGFNVSVLAEEGWPAFDLERTESTGRTLLGFGGGTAQDLAEGIIGIDRYGDDGNFYFKIESKQKELSLYADNKITLHSTDKMTFTADDADFDFEGNGINLTGDRLTLSNKEWGIFPVYQDGVRTGFVLTDSIHYDESARTFDLCGLYFGGDDLGHTYTFKGGTLATTFVDSRSSFSPNDRLSLYKGDAESFLGSLVALDETYGKQILDSLTKGSGTYAIGQKPQLGKTVNFMGKNANAIALDPNLGKDMNVDAVGDYSAIFGSATRAEGKRAFAQGTNTLAKGNYSHSEGDNSVAYGTETHAEGYATTAIGLGSHTEGNQSQTKTTKYAVPSGSTGGSGQGGAESGSTGSGWNIEEHRGDFSHAEGLLTIASGYVSHAEGTGSVADGHVSHAEGESTLASGRGAKSFGYKTTASGDYSVAGGYDSKATNKNAFAFGDANNAEGENSVAFGNGNQVNAKNGFAVGFANIVYGDNDAKNGVSIGEGLYSYNGCVTLGKYNVRDDTKARNNVLEIGAGQDNRYRKTALWVDDHGHVCVSDAPTNANDVANKSYVDNVSQDGWKFLGTIVEKSFTETPTEVKPGSSGTVDSANGYMTVNTFGKILGGVTQYKTVVDVTFRSAQFNLNPVDIQAALVTYGTKWFMPYMRINRDTINDLNFTRMLQILYRDRANVGFSWDEVSVFRDMSVSTGSLNGNGTVLAQGSFSNGGITTMAILAELDTDNKKATIAVTGAHYKITFYHPNSIL